jgi:LAS superfamily LD-carboxypeptidase LdcB
MLGELKGIGNSMDNLSNMIMMMMQSGGGGAGGGGGGAGSIGSSISNMVLKTLGLAGAVAVGATGANMVSDIGKSPPAGGDQMSNLMAALRQQESGSVQGDYKAQNPESSASGAYQFLDGTWKEAAARAGVGGEYERAMDAPKDIQDQVAQSHANYLLKQANGDVNQLSVMWHGGVTRADPSRVNEKDEEYRAQFNEKYQQIAQQRGSQEPAAMQTNASSPNTSTDFKEFLAKREQPGVDAEGLNPDFANRLMKAIQAAEQATGEKVMLTSGVRTYAQQAQLYANKHQEAFKGKDGTVYEPNGDPEPNPVAFPGNSTHESGNAVDIAAGPARDWIRAHASEFGLNDLKNDPPHFTSNSKGEKTNAGTAAEDTPTDLKAFGAAMASLNAGQPQQGETLMAGLGMPAGMGPSSEPTPVGMGDMSSYNPMGILGALAGGNMFGPSGQVGAAGAAISVLGAAANRFEPSEPDNRGARLNQTAVKEKTEIAAPLVNPDAPQEQPMQQQAAPQQQSSTKEVSQDTYNHPSDRNVSPSWTDRLLGLFPHETSGVNQAWMD